MRKLLSIFLVLLTAMPLHAQQIRFNNIQPQLNLPAEECYNVIQDDKGYIWICTENGLCRYNGSSIKIFNELNGLPERGVYFIGKSRDGIIRLITSRNRILRIESDSLVEEKFSAAFLDMIGDKTERAYVLTTDDNNDFMVATNRITYRINRVTNKISNIVVPDYVKATADYALISQAGEDYFIRVREIIYSSKFTKPYNVIVESISKKGIKEIPLLFDAYVLPDWRTKTCKIGDITFFSIQNKLIRIDENKDYSIYTLPGRILNLYASGNSLWVGMFQKGACYYKDINTMLPEHCLNDYSVTGTLTDREGGVWCTTLEKSVFYCSDINVLDYTTVPALKKPATLLKSLKDVLYVSTEFDSYMMIANGKVASEKFNTSKNTETMDVFEYKGELYFSNKGYLPRIKKNSKEMSFVRSSISGADVSSYQLDTFAGKFYSVSYTDVFELNGDIATPLAPRFTTKGSCMLCYSEGIFYIGCMDGLYRLNANTHSLIKVKGISYQVSRIIKTRSREVWIATKGEGLFLLKDGIAEKVSFKNFHIPLIVNDLVEDKYNTIWAATGNGLLKISGKDGDYRVLQLNSFNGLLSDNIKKIAADKERIYVSTTEGLCSFPIRKKMINTVPPPVYINSIYTNKPVDPAKGPLTFPYNENSMVITVDALEYKNGTDSRLLYKFSGQDKGFKLATTNELHFENLAPDEYELVIYALNSDGMKSAVPVTLHFIIEKPYWLRGWFISACILIFLLIVFFSVRRIIANIKRKEEEKTRINKLISESQLSALHAQMNPHFIFNAINSIQDYILNNDEDAAYSYLTKFSRLIRMVLDNSSQSSLPLSVELETLQLYIELEQLRFENSFDLELTISEEVDEEEITIPAMLIQPYVENAIWHGLMNLNRERKGCLKIAIGKSERLLKIVIEDNGIGRALSNEYGKANLHKPLAMKLTEQRLSIIKKMEEYEEIKVMITDLHDDAGIARGTRVELFLPLMMNER